MGAQTAEANINAGIAAIDQIVDFLENGNSTFQVNKQKLTKYDESNRKTHHTNLILKISSNI